MRKSLTTVVVIGLLAYGLLYAQAAAISVRITVDGVNTDITATTRQVQLLNRRLSEFNAQRTANGQATVTMGVYLRGILIAAIRGEEVQAESHEQAEACAAYQALSQANRNAIDAQLGNKSPCR